MFCKNSFLSFFVVVMVSVCSVAVYAQDATITGKVTLKGESGSTPVEGATVNCYLLTDFTEATENVCSPSTTDKDGVYRLTGLRAGAKYILSVGGAGIGPRRTDPVKPGSKDGSFIVEKGEGKILSKIEVWKDFAYAKQQSGRQTDDQKKALAQYKEKSTAISAKNEKIEANNAKIGGLLKEGTAAYVARDYDLAIAKFEEGFKVSPDFVGSAPVFLNNKSAALKNRAVETYNTAVKTKDAVKINEGKAKAEKDLSNIITASHASYELLRNAKTSDITNQETHRENLFNSVDYAREAIWIMVQLSLVDIEKAELVKTLVAGYLDMEKDKTKKGKAQTTLASYIMLSGDFNSAIIEFKKALGYSGNDPDILAGLGLSLYSASYESNDRAQQQESLNYMAAYLKTAPKDHIMREGIAGAIEDLTKNKKLKPKKIN